MNVRVKFLVQMNEDELHHRDTALNAGGFPAPVMTGISGMTNIII